MIIGQTISKQVLSYEAWNESCTIPTGTSLRPEGYESNWVKGFDHISFSSPICLR